MGLKRKLVRPSKKTIRVGGPDSLHSLGEEHGERSFRKFDGVALDGLLEILRIVLAIDVRLNRMGEFIFPSLENIQIQSVFEFRLAADGFGLVTVAELVKQRQEDFGRIGGGDPPLIHQNDMMLGEIHRRQRGIVFGEAFIDLDVRDAHLVIFGQFHERVLAEGMNGLKLWGKGRRCFHMLLLYRIE
jgi:hypothetical protein